MQPKNLIHRVSAYSTIVKVNIALVVCLVIAATVAISFASSENPNAEGFQANTATQPASCTARVAMVLDRSSSIGVRRQGGSHQLATAVQDGAISIVNSLTGPDKYTDLYTFASVAQRVNGADGWYPVNETTTVDGKTVKNSDIQNVIIKNETRFKVTPAKYDSIVLKPTADWRNLPANDPVRIDQEKLGVGKSEPSLVWTGKLAPEPGPYWVDDTPLHYSFGEGDVYDDRLNQGGEGATNWEAALQLIKDRYKESNQKPTHIVFFTDGNPTTNPTEINALIAAGGVMQGDNKMGTTEDVDKQNAIALATEIRSWGTKIIPVGLSSPTNTVNSALLQDLAGAGNKVITGSITGSTSTVKKEVAELFASASGEICTKSSSVYVRMIKEGTNGTQDSDFVTGTVKVTTADTFGGPAGVSKQTDARLVPNVDEFGGTRWGAFETNKPWGVSLEATAPTGYQIVATDQCTYDGKNAMPEGDVTKNDHAKGTYAGVPAGENIFCQFIVRPLATTTSPTTTVPSPNDSTLKVRVVVDGTQNSANPTYLSVGVSGSHSELGVLTTKYTSATGSPWAVWGFAPSQNKWMLGLASDDIQGYEFVSGASFCSLGSLDSTKKLTEADPEEGARIIVEDIASGKQNVFCELVVKPTSSSSTTTTTTPGSTTTTTLPSTTTTLPSTPSIEIVKSAEVDSAVVGDNVRYYFTIRNTSNVTLKGIKLTDDKFGDIAELDELAPGETANVYDSNDDLGFEFEITADKVSNGQLVNVATVCFDEPVATKKCASDDHVLTVTQVAGVSVTTPSLVNKAAGALAFTGSTSSSLAIIAGAILAAGVVIFLLSRKKKHHLS